MKIEIIAHYYNEEKLAPLFFDIYSFADKIHIFLDLDSTEDSQQILYKYQEKLKDKIEIIPFRFFDGIDDIAMIGRINSKISQLKCDWIINTDLDEFIFALPPKDTIKDFLIRHDYADIVMVPLWQIYRHKSENDLDYSNLKLSDRCHGDPIVMNEANMFYVKPMIIRNRMPICYEPGKHNIRNMTAYKVAKDSLYGVHWAMADPALAVERRYYGRTLRMSQINYRENLASHLFKLTPESIIEECKQHENDPKLFDLSYIESRENDKVSILIPYVRPHGASRCIDAIHKNAGTPESQYEIIAEEDKKRIGCAQKLKQLVEKSNYEIVMFLGDDTIPQKDFLRNALASRERLPEKWGMVGLNDHYLNGYFVATHWMADKRLLTDVLDGEFFHTGYRHCFADNELSERCIAAGKYIFGTNACIDHMNPLTKKDSSLMDKDYKWAYAQENFLHDKFLYQKRRANNWK